MDLNKMESDSNPAEALYLKLRSLDMTIKEFVYYASQAQIYPILQEFNVRVAARIIQEPFSTWYVTAGESLSIELKAHGFPLPSYQWFKDDQPLPNTNRDVLHIPSTCVEHSGVYHCRVWNDGSESVQSKLIHVNVSAAKPLVIREHPCSFTISANGIVILRCEVWGDVKVTYQWMRNGVEIHDDQHSVEGSTNNELRISNTQNNDWTGSYCCKISRGEEVVFTRDAIVQVSDIKTISYTATDKVALLMGAEDYRSEERLPGSRNDVKAMAKVFSALNFKVVSLMNLTKQEMLAAVDKFKDMVGEGVYCVFYFVGHGFEVAGQCFLVPPDAPQGYDHTHCLSADYLLFNVLLPQRPQMCVMILDICRLRVEGNAIPQILKPPEAQYFVCYGTSSGLSAYEKNQSGILVNHLKYILYLPMGIEDMFRRLREKIQDDPLLKEKEADGEGQAPEIRTTLTQTKRSFHDRIDSSGHTEEFIDRARRWEMWKPGIQDMKLQFPGFNVCIKLEFCAEFSNELTIFTSVENKGEAKICQARVSEISAEVADNAQVHMIQEGTETSLCRNYLTLHNLQSLKTNLTISVTVTCILHDDRKEEKSQKLDLQQPLVASLCLWRNSQSEENDPEEFVGVHV